MKNLTLALLACAAALASAACTQTPMQTEAGAMMTDSEMNMMKSCMSMSHDDMMKNMGCTDMMAKMNMSDSDMTMMMSCKSMSRDMMMKDQNCMTMSKMHPDMMKMM